MSDERVSLVMTVSKFYHSWSTLSKQITYAIAFTFEFKNRSGEEILLRYSKDDWSLVDNVGRDWSCDLQHWDEHKAIPVSNGETKVFAIGCGGNQQFDQDVSYVILSVKEFSSLGSISWKIDIPR